MQSLADRELSPKSAGDCFVKFVKGGIRRRQEEEERDPQCGRKRARQVLVFENPFRAPNLWEEERRKKIARIRVSSETIGAFVRM